MTMPANEPRRADGTDQPVVGWQVISARNRDLSAIHPTSGAAIDEAVRRRAGKRVCKGTKRHIWWEMRAEGADVYWIPREAAKHPTHPPKTCECFARMAGECACGAWDQTANTPDQRHGAAGV